MPNAWKGRADGLSWRGDVLLCSISPTRPGPASISLVNCVAVSNYQCRLQPGSLWHRHTHMANSSIRKFSLIVALGIAAAIVAGCPGTERVTAPPNGFVTDTILDSLQQTGSVQTGAEGSGQPALAYPATDILVGDEDGNVNGTAVRGFIGFSLKGTAKGHPDPAGDAHHDAVRVSAASLSTIWATSFSNT